MRRMIPVTPVNNLFSISITVRVIACDCLVLTIAFATPGLAIFLRKDLQIFQEAMLRV
jgi:hypothetical protein